MTVVPLYLKNTGPENAGIYDILTISAVGNVVGFHGMSPRLK